MENYKTVIYKLSICGTDKLIGVGMIGNLEMLLCLYFHYKCNIYFDMYSNGHCIVYDKDYEIDSNITNPFEYYFEPLFDIKNINQEIFFPESHWSFPEIAYGKFELKYKNIYYEIRNMFFKNYKIKDDILNFINYYEETHLNCNDILGVHIRASDMMATGQNYDIEYFINKIKYILEKRTINKIFLATDDNEIIKTCTNIFNTKEILYLNNIERVDNINRSIGQHDRINTENHNYNSRKYHNYLCGKEVIIDTFLLSKCNYFLRSNSAVSDLAILFSDKIQEVFN